MKNLLTPALVGFFALFSGLAFAQKSPIKFGDISMDEMTMKSYEPDSSASAVVLSDYGEAYILINTSAATMNFERHTRIKILRKEGLAWADVAIQLYHSGVDEERVSGLKASSFNLEDGKIVETKLSKDGIFREKFNKNINLQKFTLPNVKEGTVIEFSYKIISDFVFNFPNWQFQYTIPVKRSEYWAILPDFLVFEKFMQGYLVVSDYQVKSMRMTDYQANAHHWVLNGAPAFRPEPFMTTEKDFISRINFAISHIQLPGNPVQEIMGSWEKLNKDLLESEAFGKAITGSNFLKKTVEEITAGMTDPLEKAVAIHNYVRQNIEWDGTLDMLADPLKKVFDLKKGTAGDINIALASMLEKAGIPVNMIILSTRDHGFIRKTYPMTKQFNYVVCEAIIDGKPVLLDATERFLPIDILPERCLNGEGLRISATQFKWVDLTPKAKSKTVVSAAMALDPEGTITGELSFLRYGYAAGRMRKDYVRQGQEEYLKNLFGNKSWHVESSAFEDMDALDKATREVHQLSIEEHATLAGDVIYVSPFVTSRIEANPFRQDNREYPVDFGSPIEQVYTCTFTVPDGYEVDELPQSKMLAMPGNAARFLFNVAQTQNTVSITSNFSINKNLFLQADYALLKEFYNQVVAKQSEQIVLKKK